ncbi:MAG: D-2-hydroxyacid dehydrogenase [Candidatus Pacebacteria bacterium]|nr:D-2-hydroxyacid dehydrogenase [Candidatus Paceibacterota bacterium]
MNIVVLDGGTLNPGDLSWDSLGNFGNYKVYDSTPNDKVIHRSQNADILIINKINLTRNIILQLPNLKYIGVTATGYNVVDTEAAKDFSIVVTNVPTYGTRSVAQMTFSLILELCQHSGEHSKTVHEGKWSQCPDFCYWDYPLIELNDLTIGIVGFGKIGQATAAIAKAFGMKVIVYDVFCDNCADEEIKFVTLNELLAKSDFVTLHCPLTSENKGLINAERLSKMKKTAFIINTSRGQLINETDLGNALNTGQIAGAGLDVLSKEPPDPSNPLLKVSNCIITPHIAWATRSARMRLMDTVISNIASFVSGNTVNTV